MSEESVVLNRAAEIVVGRGWTQGTTVDSEGHVCAVGAVLMAAREYDNDTVNSAMVGQLAISKLRRYVNEQRFKTEPGRFYGLSVPNWNDNVCTSVEDVVLGMKGAANDDR